MARGPRAIIASQIAQVLGEYFVVNPDDIESSLLSDAKIVLRDTKIRKKEYCNASSSAPDTVITVSGIVQEVIFSWKWSFSSAGGGTGTSSSSSSRGAGMVQDAALSIRGLKVILELDRRVSEVHDDDILNTPSKVNESNSEKAGFLQNYIQQIVDHLTVKVDNFEVIFQAKGGPSMDVRGKDLALVTLASAKVPSDTSVATKTILSQSISIEMFAITVNDNQDECSLIEPFGYTASVTRLFGKRFQDGIFSGLDVTGLPKVQEKVKIHVGPRQIHVLCALSMYMAPTKSSYMEKEHALMEQQCHNKPSDSDSVNASDFSTMFTFPLPEVTLVISQDITMSPYEPTEITIPSVVVSFRSDGGIFRVEGCGDIDCNGRTTLQMLDGACWDLDLIAQTFIIKQKDDYKKHDKTNCKSCLLTLVLNEESLLPLVSNVHSVINNHEIYNLRAAFETSVTQLETLRGTNQSLKPWIIAVDGSIQLIAESSFGGTRDVDRINATVRSIRAVAVVDKSKGSYMFNEFDCGGIKVMSNIDIDAWLDVPTFRLAENAFSFNGIMNFCIQSVEKGRKLQRFALRFKAIFSDSSISDDSTPAMLPFDVFMVGARLHLSEGAGLTEKGSVVKLEGIRIAIEGTNMTATIEEVSNVNIPEVLILTEPTHNIYAKYDGNHLLLDLNSVKCNIPLGDCGEELSNQKSFDAMVFCLPISIQMRINWFIVESLVNKNGISIQNIELGLKPNGSTILIQTERELTFKLYESTDDWLQVELKIISANVGIENGVLDIKRFECRGVDIGPTSQSCGDLCAVIPPCNHDGETLAVDNFITVNITSVDAASNVLSLVQKVSSLIFKSSSSFELPFPIDLQGIKISLAEPKSDVFMLKVKGSSTNILCSKIDADVAKKACVSADEIAMNLQTSELDIGRINSFTVTDIFSLSKPLLRSKMTCRNTYCISLPNEVQIKMQIPLESSPSSHEYKLDTNNTGDQMDFPVQIHLNQLTIINMGRDINLRVFNLHLGTRPSSNGSNDFQYQAQSTRGTDLTLSIGKASCELFELSELNISLLLQPRDFATFRNLKIGLESVKVTAGFSNIDWACFFPQKNDCSGAKRLSIISTPFPEIDSFPLSVSYKGKVLSTRSNIQVPPFSGNATTTSDHIILYYKNVALERIPGFLTNVEFMGENLIDSSLKNTGMSVVGAATKTLSGAGLGSMAGVAVADAIRAGIDSGKKSRNANASDGYKFGDFTRGIIRGTRENAEIGAKMRGDPGTYVPGDLIVGSSKAAGEYVKNNKAKLSTAGGSGIGATVGLAVAGPLGFVVGSYLGGKTAQGIVVDDNQGQSKTKGKVAMVSSFFSLVKCSSRVTIFH
jgi:hypothetical protein